MTNKEALKLCASRLKFVANLYGAKWREEQAFLRPCLNALEECENTKARNVEDEDVPHHENMVLCDVEIITLHELPVEEPEDLEVTQGEEPEENAEDEITEPQVIREVSRKLILAKYVVGEGWQPDYPIEQEFNVLRWSELPSWVNVEAGEPA